mgnify:FL=1
MKGIKLKLIQLENLAKDSKQLQTDITCRRIDLFINENDLSLIWLKNIKKPNLNKNENFTLPKFVDKEIVYLGSILSSVTEEELKQFIYNRIFTLKIRQQKLFYGSPEVRQLHYQNFNNNKFKA